jgi:urea transport system substrate-binding protein
MRPDAPENSADETQSSESSASPSAHRASETFVPDGSDTSSKLAGSGTWRDAADVGYWVGRRLGKYDVIAVLGSGGMGVVYKAHDSLIERDVAIKVLPRELSENPTILRRFLAEAKSAGRLNHPNAVAIYEVARDNQTDYLVMEFVPGGSVADQLVKRGPLPVAEATRILAEACKGIAAAHAVELVHRDVKPANLLLALDGSVKVADFGLAKGPTSNSEQVTQAGTVVGTPYFMSPEQCEGRTVDHRSDLYSLGATYYSLLTGANPYEKAGSVMQVMYGHCQGPILDPRELNAAVPAACAQIIAQATAKLPDGRYRSAAEMLTDLNTVLATLSGSGIVLPSHSGIAVAPSFPSAMTIPAVSQRRKLLLWGAGLAICLLAGITIGLGVHNRSAHSFGDTPIDAATSEINADNLPVVVAPAGPPIKIGILHSLTGTLADSESPVVDVALLAIAEINAIGGVLGRPVEAIVRDGNSDAAVFAAEARRLIEDEQVCTVFGCWTSSSRKTVVPIFEEHDHLLVYPVQYEGLETSPVVFYTGAAPNQQIIPAVKWAFAFNDKRRFFLVGSDYVFPRTAGAIIKDTLHELGAELVGQAYLPLGSPQFEQVVQQIVAAKPDVILNTINGDSNIAFFRDLRRANITPETIPTISFSIGEEELRHLNPAHMAGDYAAWNYFQSIDSPENRQFVERVRTKYGPQRVITDPMEAAWFGVKLWAEGVAAAGSDKPAEIRRAMRNLRMTAPEGEVRLDPVTQHTFKTPRIGRILPSGQFEIVWTATKPEAPLPFPRSRTTEQWHTFLQDLYTGWGGQWSAPVE